MRLQDLQDFITPLERTIYKLTEAGINSTKDTLRKAEEFFAVKSERFGHVFAASGLRQEYPPATLSVSFDWALISVHSSRLSKNELLPIGEAPYQLRKEFRAFSGQILPSSLELPPLGSNLFMLGRSTGFTMGRYKGQTETAMCSWKADEKGHIRKTITCEHMIQPDGDTFGKAGDSGAAIYDRLGRFVGLYFAGNTYTGLGYFTAAKDLFSDIKRMTSAEEVDLLPVIV